VSSSSRSCERYSVRGITGTVERRRSIAVDQRGLSPRAARATITHSHAFASTKCRDSGGSVEHHVSALAHLKTKLEEKK
jgi:hypothetical protein